MAVNNLPEILETPEAERLATHHATPENGSFPGRGEEEEPRVFTTDLGWEVTLLEGYVTISAVTLVACNDSEIELNMFWGPCPEDLKDQDLATLTVAGNRAREGDYCTLRVTYAPYETPVIDEDHDDRVRVRGRLDHQRTDLEAASALRLELRLFL